MPSDDSRMPLRGLLLDIDDTLLTTRVAMSTAVAVAVHDLWPDLPEGAPERAAHRFAQDPTGIFDRYVAGRLTFEEMRLARVADAAALLGRVVPPDAEVRWRAAFDAAFLSRLELFRDVATALDRAASAGLQVGALTNSSGPYTARKLAAVGLGETFGVVVSRDTLGVGKPSPEVFHHAVSLLGLAPGDCAHVGDELVIDAVGAQEAGLTAIWLRRDGYGVEPQHRAQAQARGIPLVRTLTEALDLVVTDPPPKVAWPGPDGRDRFGGSGSDR